MATEALKLLTGIGEPLIGRVVLFDALTGTTPRAALRARSGADAASAAPAAEAAGSGIRSLDLGARPRRPAERRRDGSAGAARCAGAARGRARRPAWGGDRSRSANSTPGSASWIRLPSTVVYCHLGVRSAAALDTSGGAWFSRASPPHRRRSTPGRGRSTRRLTPRILRPCTGSPSRTTPPLSGSCSHRSATGRTNSVPIALAAGRVTAGEVRQPDRPADLPQLADGRVRRARRRSSGASRCVLPVVGEIAAGAQRPRSPAGRVGGRHHDRSARAARRRRRRADRRHPDGRRFGSRSLRGRDAGEYVREPGSDIAAGAVLLPGRAAPRVAAPRRARRGQPASTSPSARACASPSSAPATSSSRPGRRSATAACPTRTASRSPPRPRAVGADVVDVQLGGRRSGATGRRLRPGDRCGRRTDPHERRHLDGRARAGASAARTPRRDRRHRGHAARRTPGARAIPRRAGRLLPRQPGQQPAELRPLRRPAAARDSPACRRSLRSDAPARRAAAIRRRAPAVPARTR